MTALNPVVRVGDQIGELLEIHTDMSASTRKVRVIEAMDDVSLPDPAGMAEESLYDSDAMRRFAGLELGDDRVPDETTILNFRHLLERHALPEAIFADVNAYPKRISPSKFRGST